MKKLLMCFMLFFLLSGKSNAQLAVTAPYLEGQMAAMLGGMSVQTDIMVLEKLAKTSIGFLQGMQSLRSLINVVNAVSCTAMDFNFYLRISADQNFWNCWLSDYTNRIINSVASVVDVLNLVTSALFSSSPSDRAAMVERISEKYFKAELDMRMKVQYIKRKMRDRHIAVHGRAQGRNISAMVISRKSRF